jgi:hypothetical protein
MAALNLWRGRGEGKRMPDGFHETEMRFNRCLNGKAHAAAMMRR